MLVECFVVLEFVCFSKCMRDMLLYRKPEVLLDLCCTSGLYGLFSLFFFFNLLFVFSTRRTSYKYERIGKLDVSGVNDLWFRLKELRLLH